MTPLTPRFTVTLEGQTLPLRFELFDWAEAERILKVPLLPFGETEFWKQPGLSQNAVLLFVGLRHAMPGLTLEQIHERVTWENHGPISAVLQDALAAFFQRLQAMAAAPAPEASSDEPTTGTNSGLSDDTTSH
jgi:hypothetical protein